MLLLAISSASLHIFYSETLHDNLPVVHANRKKETTSCQKAAESPKWTSSLIAQRNSFLANQRDEFGNWFGVSSGTLPRLK